MYLNVRIFATYWFTHNAMFGLKRACLMIFLFLCSTCARFATNHENLDPKALPLDKAFVKRTQVEPKIYQNADKLTIFVSSDLILDLKQNTRLIPRNFFQKIENKIAPSSPESDFCHYQGTVKDRNNSWVAISTCEGLSGVIFDGSETLYIEKNVLYQHSDLVKNDKSCGFNETKSRDKRSPFANQTGPRPSTNSKSRYLELLLVIDHEKYLELDKNATKVEIYSKTIANIVNSLYAPLNIHVALVGVITWSGKDMIDFSTNAEVTLSHFLAYRRHITLQHPNDNAQLITKKQFANAVLGKTLNGPICTYEYSGGVVWDYNSLPAFAATSVAHMLGHNFGMPHDGENCTCEDDRCIMSPSSFPVLPTKWSNCSKSALKRAFDHGMDYCLRNRPNGLFRGSACGNGFVEEGEECDCGLPDSCTNRCCDAKTCMLTSNATCATGECCQLDSCKLKEAGEVCRSEKSECDLPEFCTGQSEFCPDDVYKMDATKCQDGAGFCYEGLCGSRDDQCKLLWGHTGKNSVDECYGLNNKGTRHGNCGWNQGNREHPFEKCADEDVLCGLLHCEHSNEGLEFGLENTAIISHSFIRKQDGRILTCREVLIDLGLGERQPGLVPNGAKCGQNQMCVNQKCVNIANVPKKRKCPHDCYNNGFCDNLGHCHCKSDYMLPFCEKNRPGGSVIDSGPDDSSLNITTEEV